MTPPYLILPEGRAFVALGANLGEPAATVRAAIAAISALPGTRVLAASRLHVTAPVGPPQPDFVNAVVEVETGLAPRGLLDALLELERSFGRVRIPGERWGPRLLDLDLIAHGDCRMDEAELILPHPRADERLFVLVPLADVIEPTTNAGLALAGRLRQLGGSPG